MKYFIKSTVIDNRSSMTKLSDLNSNSELSALTIKSSIKSDLRISNIENESILINDKEVDDTTIVKFTDRISYEAKLKPLNF